jgi:NAD(P)-dependent dehydrogenase (short-subunit alcohol dehydrogenase family)
MDIQGWTAVVTGAGSGIGRELAREFARHQANVVCAGRRLPPLEETVALIEGEGGHASIVQADVSLWDDVQRLVEQTISRYGQIDLLFNNAGSFQCVGPVWEADPEAWWQDVTTNLLGTMMCCRAVLPHMIERDQGVVFNMDGGGGTPGPCIGGSGYGASKAAIVRFTEGLAGELERIGSSVLAFSMNPGFVRSPMTEYLIDTPYKAKWQSHVVDLMDSEEEVPPDACAKAAMQLLEIASPALNGRAFSPHVDYDQVSQNKARIEQDDLFVLRWVTLDD